MKFHRIDVLFMIAAKNDSKRQTSRSIFCHYFDEMSTCNSMTILTKIRLRLRIDQNVNPNQGGLFGPSIECGGG